MTRLSRIAMLAIVLIAATVPVSLAEIITVDDDGGAGIDEVLVTVSQSPTCVVIQRGTLGKVADASILQEKPFEN